MALRHIIRQLPCPPPPPVVPRNVTYRLSYFSVLSNTHKPCRVISQFECALWVSKIPATSICNYSVSYVLIVGQSFGVLGR